LDDNATNYAKFILYKLFCFLAIHTAAMDMLSGSDSSNLCRKPEIMSDAVYALLCKDSKSITGQFLIDEDILKNEGITDFTDYACNPGNVRLHFIDILDLIIR